MEIQPQINSVKLTHKSLINITKDYHGYVCDYEECIIYEKQLPAIKIQIAPVVGVTVSKIKFDKGFYSRFNYDRNINQSYGIQLNTTLPRISEKASLQMEVLYNKNDYYGIYNDDFYDNYYESYIKNVILQSSLAIKYTFPKGKVRPTTAVGVTSIKLFNLDIKGILNNDPINPNVLQQFNENDLLRSMPTNLFGVFVQLGCNYRFVKNHEMFTNLKYSLNTDNDYNVYVRTIINSVNFTVGFYF